MPKCKKFEAQTIDYATGELDDAQATEYKHHLNTCNQCVRQVNAIKHVLQLVDNAEAEITPQAIVPPNLETKLYRRLAEVPSEKPTLRSRLMDYLSRFEMILQFQKAAIVCLLVVSAIAITFFIDNPFQNDQIVQLNQADSVDTRIAQYHQQGIQRSMEDVMRIKHLRNPDEWNTLNELNRVKDKAQGTDWAAIDNKH